MSLTHNRKNTNSITNIHTDTNKSSHRVHLIKDDNEFVDSLYSEEVKTLPKAAIKCT
jgi:hypothetical protein